MMNELEYYQLIGHRLPRYPHMSGIANRILKPVYNRKARKITVSNVLGARMELNPNDMVDGNLLFCPQLYDYNEIRFLRKVLGNDSTFIDVGSHIGFYSLMASQNIDKNGQVIAIEADPKTYERLKINIALNDANITAINNGVSDKDEILYLSQSEQNTGGQSLMPHGDNGVKVQCRPLPDILDDCGIKKITLMKLDIEGFEYKVLHYFLQNVHRSLFPEYLITEFRDMKAHDTTGDQIELLKEYGYQEMPKPSSYNRILKQG